jgi:gluconate 5-dehydrogenase
VEDLVGTLIYLSSDASAFVNGQIVYVDGGMLSVL